MFGAIAGDVIGAHYEAFPTKQWNFVLFPEDARFTDDTVLTTAVAEWLLNGRTDLAGTYHRYVNRYPHAGYGGSFLAWAHRGETQPYHSWGNGSAMRVSPVAYAATSVEEALALARQTAVVTHDHPEGIRGAQAVALAVYLARSGHGQDEVRRQVEQRIGYDLSRSLTEIRPEYEFDVSCAGSVPQSIIAFLESTDFEGAVRNAVSLGGDADTMACIAGAIAEPFYGGVPAPLLEATRQRLDQHILGIADRFCAEYVG